MDTLDDSVVMPDEWRLSKEDWEKACYIACLVDKILESGDRAIDRPNPTDV
jgi:hypothetical protein